MTLALDYLDHPELKALLQLWWAEGKPPFVLRDWLLDRGLEGQAECAGWIEKQTKKLKPKSNYWGKHLPTGHYYWGKSGVDYFGTEHHALPDELTLIASDFGDACRDSRIRYWPAFSTTDRAYCGLLDGYAKWKGFIQ